MIEKLNYKMAHMISNRHSQCGAMRMTDHFVKAHNVTSDMKVASLIAAIPCARHIAGRVKAKWRGWMGKIL